MYRKVDNGSGVRQDFTPLKSTNVIRVWDKLVMRWRVVYQPQCDGSCALPRKTSIKRTSWPLTRTMKVHRHPLYWDCMTRKGLICWWLEGGYHVAARAVLDTGLLCLDLSQSQSPFCLNTLLSKSHLARDSVLLIERMSKMLSDTVSLAGRMCNLSISLSLLKIFCNHMI